MEDGVAVVGAPHRMARYRGQGGGVDGLHEGLHQRLLRPLQTERVRAHGGVPRDAQRRLAVRRRLPFLRMLGLPMRERVMTTEGLTVRRAFDE